MHTYSLGQTRGIDEKGVAKEKEYSRNKDFQGVFNFQSNLKGNFCLLRLVFFQKSTNGSQT